MKIHLALLLCGVLLPSFSEAAIEIKLSDSKRALLVNEGTNSRECILPHESEKAWVSFDGEAVILSEREYVPVRGLVQCKEQVPVVVKEIPEGVGFLVDINIRKGIYLTLDFISTNPLSYLATVARIGHSKNMFPSRAPMSNLWICRNFNGTGSALIQSQTARVYRSAAVTFPPTEKLIALATLIPGFGISRKRSR
ncbi:hypothetical protein [Chitiniphilus shinanonensis]|uniref:hypothetical protein n=1 Tax=Chitiniphilus shinanonensis TaxID=553088 RepID=UPI0033422F5D